MNLYTPLVYLYIIYNIAFANTFAKTFGNTFAMTFANTSAKTVAFNTLGSSEAHGVSARSFR